MLSIPINHNDNDHHSFKSNHSVARKMGNWIKLIFSDKTSRNLFFFLCLNLTFAFVELLYGMWTNSLGLISDSFHMFFDCTALLAGLVASIITKWQSNERFTYGYGRAEVLAGFINGLFLLFIGFFIFSEAIERMYEPPVVKHDRLFLVSVLGFLVNIIGIFAFQHGGAGHDHSHDHSHNHVSHGHSHSLNAGSTMVLQGVFLHILADTLGSVGVIISSILISQFHWHIADPICSLFIAIMIVVSVAPLLKDSVCVLMQRSPTPLDDTLPECFHRVNMLDGVYSVQEPHFWTLCSGIMIGALKVEVAADADSRYISSQVENIFTQVGIRQLYVQIDRAHV